MAVVEACLAAPDEFACVWILVSLRSPAARVRRFLMSGNPGADSAFARPFDMAALPGAVAAAVANRIGGELFGNGA
jgi:hypothetical protein